MTTHNPSNNTPALLTRATLALGGLLLALSQGSAQAAENSAGIQITERGEGQPVLMIPGLNSSAEVWSETCDKLQPGVRCLMAQLPGFAGAPASEAARKDFLATTREQLKVQLAKAAPQGATVVGHSLGGVLALMLAAEADSKVSQLVIVDSLPFLPGIQNPNATIESVRPMAQAMRDGAQRATPEQMRVQMGPMLATMSRQAERQPTMMKWMLDSDPKSSGQAMYELWTTDLRPLLPRIQAPTTVLGAWAAYAPMGSTLDSTRAIFERQYAGLAKAELRMSAQGYHFLMWDDAELVQAAIREAVARR